MNIYQEEILDPYKNPRHRGTVEDATTSATVHTPSCGDELTVTLRIESGSVAEIAFDGEGCAISTAAASMLAEELHGKSLPEVKDFSDQDIFEMIGVELTPTRQKCGLLAVSALRTAL